MRLGGDELTETPVRALDGRKHLTRGLVTSTPKHSETQDETTIDAGEDDDTLYRTALSSQTDERTDERSKFKAMLQTVVTSFDEDDAFEAKNSFDGSNFDTIFEEARSGREDSCQTELGQYDSGQKELGQYDSGKTELGQYDLGQKELGQYDSSQEEKLGHEQSGHKESGHEESGHEESGHDQSGQDEWGHEHRDTPAPNSTGLSTAATLGSSPTDSRSIVQTDASQDETTLAAPSSSSS